MHRSKSRRQRRLGVVVAAGLALTLTPVWSSSPVLAEAPVVRVTGLELGDRGDAVRSVQEALVRQGVPVAGGVDGVFGSGTQSALKSFQRQVGLRATGVVDEATAVALGLQSNPYFGLAPGARGNAVRALQQRLLKVGVHVSGGADGIYGPGTEEAVSAFQRRVGYAATGSVNAATAVALRRASTSSSSGGSGGSAGSGGGDGGIDGPASTTTGASRGGSPEVTTSSESLVGLKIGATGPSVARLQRLIMDAGFTVVGGADGVFGVLTASALRSFQNANGLSVTGVVDAATAKALGKVGASGEGGGSADPAPVSPLQGLRYGSIGSDVKALQEALMAAGISVRGGADGVFGEATRTAVRAFQSAKGLEVTGKVDRATARALTEVVDRATNADLVGLRAGALGNTVRRLQQLLIDAGIDVRGGADGIFGPATASALQQFQRSQGLDATGVVDRATAAALADPSPIHGASGGSSSGGFAQYGEKGSRVIALQEALVKAGIAVRGGVDGQFGGGTAAAVIEFQRREGLSVTGKVDDATGRALGLRRMPAPTAPDPSTVKLSVFPVQGRCGFTDTFGYPRGGGRVHQGVDVIAPEGNRLYAVVAGTITKVYVDYPGSLAGNGVRLTMADGTYFFYAHMSKLTKGIEEGTKVRAGQVLGLVGSTGNAGTAHLHFEVHPQGGAAVNPYPLIKAIDGCSNTSPRR